MLSLSVSEILRLKDVLYKMHSMNYDVVAQKQFILKESKGKRISAFSYLNLSSPRAPGWLSH